MSVKGDGNDVWRPYTAHRLQQSAARTFGCGPSLIVPAELRALEDASTWLIATRGRNHYRNTNLNHTRPRRQRL